MNRYRELGGAAAVPARGIMDYLSLTPEQQHAAYRARVEKGIVDHPDDAALQVSYLKLSITDGQMDRATATARKIEGMKPGAIVLADAGRAMLAARQYPLAKDLLERTAAADPGAGVELDLAIATFNTDGLAAGIARLERVPESGRGSDYYLARAQMLEAGGKPDEATAAVLESVAAEPQRPDLYWQAAVIMTRNHRAAEALQLLDRAAAALPQEPQIPVVKAAIEELTGKTDEARRLLNDAQHRWPEVAAVWVAQGIVLSRTDAEEARRALETAVSLGAHSPETFYALADSSWRAGPQHLEAARSAVAQALKSAPDDAQILELSKMIATRNSAGASRDDVMDPAKLFLTRPPRDW
jgi:tetratricopeptide (TPR) repeat protein